MPDGLFLMEWNDRTGVELKIKHAPGIKGQDLSTEALMKIYTTHKYSAESSLVALAGAETSTVSFCSGRYYLILLLDADEDPSEFDEILLETSRIIFQNLDLEYLKKNFPRLFDRIEKYPQLVTEQKYAILYQDPLKRAIIEKLMEEGAMFKVDLDSWLREKFPAEHFNLSSILNSLMSMDILKTSVVKNVVQEVVFLCNTISVFRSPCETIVKELKASEYPENLVNEYLRQVKRFFSYYKPTLADSVAIAELVSDFGAYKILEVLRRKTTTPADLRRELGQDAGNLDQNLARLFTEDVIVALSNKLGKGKKVDELLALKSDLKVVRTFPRFAINLVREKMTDPAQNNDILLKYLDILKDVYQ